MTLTASASLLTPASRPRRACSSNLRIFGITSSSSADLGEHVAAGEDQQVLAVDGDLGAAVLAVDDGVADLDVERDDLAGLLRAAAGAGGQDLALLGLLLGGVGDDEARGRGLFGLVRPDDDAVLEGLQVHGRRSSVSTLVCRVLTIPGSRHDTHTRAVSNVSLDV